jgi:hypothetical protein
VGAAEGAVDEEAAVVVAAAAEVKLALRFYIFKSNCLWRPRCSTYTSRSCCSGKIRVSGIFTAKGIGSLLNL